MTVITIEDTKTGESMKLKFVPQDMLSEKGNQLHSVQPVWDTKLEDIIANGSDIYKTALNTVLMQFNIFKNRPKAK